MQKQKEYKRFKQLVNIYYNEELEILDSSEEEIKEKDIASVDIEPTIIFDKFTGNMKIEFKIGKNRKYRIKDISEFYDRMMNKEYYRYGDKTHFTHRREMFNERSQKLLDFILKYGETLKITNSGNNSNYNYPSNNFDASRIIVGNNGIDELFEILKGEEVKFQIDGKSENIEFLDENPQIEFILTKQKNGEYLIKPNVEIFKVRIITGKQYKYILKKERLYRCSKAFEKKNLNLLEVFRSQYIQEVKLGEKELKDLFSIIVPRVGDAIQVENIPKEEIEKYKPEELVTKVYLDFDNKGYLIADVRFCYGAKEFNPLDEKNVTDFPRNIIKETKALNMFKKTGFMFDAKNLRFVLPENDKIYEFIINDVPKYAQKFEILATDKFKTKQIKQPKIGSVGVKLESGLLRININDFNIDPKEIKKILKKYTEKKKYHRLKTGEFIDIQNSKEISFIEKLVTGMEIEPEELSNGEIKVPVYRAMYLNELLKQIKGTEIIKDSEYKQLVQNLDKENIEELKIPRDLESTLRFYQKTGFKWLKILDKYKFGGILADDMGLGKTIQILSIIVDYIEGFENNNPDVIEGQESLMAEKKRASLVISPSSLTLNWQNEAKKFTSKLKTLVIRGNVQERKRQIRSIDDYDLVITSYDLLKRDINLYKELNYKFRFAIADEAQYLKNSTTQNAKSIKEIEADTRYALTGTPIENALSELWSIFDFVMPGYLFEYKRFKTNYEVPIVRDENEKTMEKLKALIQPFVLRRTKTEVLTELPEKSVTVLTSEMKEEQEELYISYLAQAKQEIAEEMKIDPISFKNNQMKILAALTRLRQICCHPSLFVKEYKDGSSKLDQCMEIITDAINGDHKVLLFSSYTSMFEIIEKELKERKINYFKLTGSTKVEERIDLVDEFNENKNIKVFLISLKAGGTGLNLTGADIVIHYDPWWNLSAENQATDRAYRIGQKNNVQVYKLITKNTIEEKIYDIQKRKAELIDNMLDNENVFVNKLSKEDILSLFN